jgi:hypothetical protein
VEKLLFSEVQAWRPRIINRLSEEESILNLSESHLCGTRFVVVRHVIDPGPRGTFSTVLFLTMQLLREVSANAHFFDGMKLSVQEVRVPFFVLEHALK